MQWRIRGWGWYALRAAAVSALIGLSTLAHGAEDRPGAVTPPDEAVDRALTAFENGHRTPAFAALRAAADAGNAYAMAVLGDLAYFGWHGPRDYVEARRWYQQAVKVSHPGGHHGLARLYIYGHGVDKDVRLSLSHLARVDEAGPWDLWAETFGGACLPDPEPVRAAERALRAYFRYAPLERPGSYAQVDALRIAFPCG